MFKPNLSKLVLSIGVIAVAGMGFLYQTAFADASANTQTATTKILAANPNMNPQALKYGLRAYDHLTAQGKDKQHVLTIVDYTKPSNDKRLWVINMNNDQTMYHTLVAQAKNSGTVYATKFSNAPHKRESSIGVFLTGQEYTGTHPDSMRLIGLTKGFDTNAYRRNVVMHPAWYVSKSFAQKYGRVGRSWGCLALSKKMEPKVVNTIKDGTVIFSYYPNKQMLNSAPNLQPVNA